MRNRQKILVGSRAFFSNISGFESKDYDYLELVKRPTTFKWRKECSLRGICTFQIKKEPIAKMIQRTIDNGDALLIGKFLVPEVAQALEATVNDILPLEALLPKLDERHKYQIVIFNAIKQNNSFILTNEQLNDAYQVYKEARQNKYKL